MPRLFVAIELPETIKDVLSEIAYGLPGARWTPRQQLHVTMRFIGEVDGRTFEDVQRLLGEVDAPAVRIALRGLGHFPLRGDPRVIWAGAHGGRELEALYRQVERSVQRAGVEPEGRKFHPHVTIARLKDTPTRRVAEYLASQGLFEAGSFVATELTLLSSVLGSTGATHRVEAAFPLVTEGVDL